jgi:hypothetical protein
MDAKFTTVVGQLSLSNGQWATQAENQVAVREPKSADAPGAGKGDVFIVTEIQGNVQNPAKMEQKLAQAIRDNYYLARGSVTASLRRALQSANDLLYKRNSQVEREDRIVGGAVVLVMSGEDAFVAQIGPTACFAILGDHIKRYPARSVWLEEALESGPEESVAGMGLTKIIEPGIHHLRVAAEDMLVLADSRLAGNLPLKEVVKAVQDGDVSTSTQKVAQAAKTSEGSVMVLGVVGPAAPAAEHAPGLKSSAAAAASKLGNLWPKTKAEPEAVAPKAKQPPDEEFAEEPESLAASLFASTATFMQKPLGWLNRKGKADEPPATDDEAPAEPAAERVLKYPPREEAPEPEPQPETYASDAYVLGENHHPGRNIWGTIGAALLAMVAMLGNGVKWLLGLLVRSEDAPRQAGAQAQTDEESAIPWRTLRVIAVLIPILVAVIVGISYLQKGRMQEAEYQEYLTAAQNKYQQAQAVDAPAAMSLMSEAEASLAQAETIKQNQAEIEALRQQMAEQADKVSQVQRLYYLPQLRQYTDPGTALSSIVVQGVDVFVMDPGNDRIYRHRLDDAGNTLLADDETVLMSAKGQVIDQITVGDMLAMTWMPTGGNRQTSDLVILNSAGLLEYSPSWGLASAALAGTNQLKMPKAVSSYFGNFYVLDPQANTLLRYLPTADGYNAAPENYFAATQNVSLANAVDLAIDGAVFILHQDGRIKKFLGGQETGFNVTGLDIPLNNPSAIFTAPDEEAQYIYIADAGNQRIVQLKKDGSFVRQFKPRADEAVTFANLQDIHVDELSGRMFILDSNNLYLTTNPTDSPAPAVAPAEVAPPAEATPPAVNPPAAQDTNPVLAE